MTNFFAILAMACTILNISLTQPIDANKIRLEEGSLYKTEYNLKDKTTNSTIKTTDGNLWKVNNYVAPDGNFVVVFDTMGTDRIEDDRIINIISVAQFS